MAPKQSLQQSVPTLGKIMNSSKQHNFNLKELEKEHTKPKVSTRREITKIREELNGMGITKAI